MFLNSFLFYSSKITLRNKLAGWLQDPLSVSLVAIMSNHKNRMYCATYTTFRPTNHAHTSNACGTTYHANPSRHRYELAPIDITATRERTMQIPAAIATTWRPSTLPPRENASAHATRSLSRGSAAENCSCMLASNASSSLQTVRAFDQAGRP